MVGKKEEEEKQESGTLYSPGVILVYSNNFLELFLYTKATKTAAVAHAHDNLFCSQNTTKTLNINKSQSRSVPNSQRMKTMVSDDYFSQGLLECLVSQAVDYWVEKGCDYCVEHRYSLIDL